MSEICVPGNSQWTGLADLRRLSATAWDRGLLLRELLEPAGAYPRRRTLKKPTAAQLRDQYPAAQAWAAELFGAVGDFSLETIELGRKTIGANSVPAAAVFERVEDEIAFTGKSKQAARVLALTVQLGVVEPALRRWAVKRPLELLRLEDAAVTAGRVALWLFENPASGLFVRQLSLPGVHTKFVERHRQTVDEMVSVLSEHARPSELSRQEDVRQPDVEVETEANADADADAGKAITLEQPSSGPDQFGSLGAASLRTPAARFAQRHGFMHPPELVRFRLLDENTPTLGSARDITMTAAAFKTLRLPVRTVIVTENLVNFLALPHRPGTMALFGAGYGFSSIREAAWLHECEVLYWGDLDTHGYRILDQLRAVHPHVSSVLMDDATLLAHRDRWVSESSPVRAELLRLNSAETSVYRSLCDDVHGPAVRLEQEVIRWDWVLDRLAQTSS
ncbi:DUF3322 and DUF2220 domain-containing protein [Arthrobacter tecti]